MEALIQQIFIERGWTLSLAESCTGGSLAARLSRLPGCSQYFLGSIVSYSNNLKVNLLGVDRQVIDQKGAVNEEVVRQMARGVRGLTHSHYSIAVSGIAGPGGGTPTKPVGTIWAAIESDQGCYTWSFHLSGQREDIIQQTVDHLLMQLLNIIKKDTLKNSA